MTGESIYESKQSVMHEVRPVHPAAAYMGGKRLLAKTLIDMIEKTEHKAYGEAFVGMGGVFFRRRMAPPSEFINDYSRDVITFFRVLQRHYEAFLDMLRYTYTSRAEFERLLVVNPYTLTDLERAARFIYLQRISYAGKVGRRTFQRHPTGNNSGGLARSSGRSNNRVSQMAGLPQSL